MLQKIERSEGHRRLARLAQELRNLPTGYEFNMATWWSCALGVAGKIPEFRSEGFIQYGHDNPRYGSFRDFEAAAAFFDIPLKMSLDLFRGHIGPMNDPRYTASRIEDALDKLALQSA